jgi:branched-chain amino acid aminotransferase
MGDGMAFIDGEFVAIEDAKISVFDSGFSRSDVVYDVTSTSNGRFFRLDDHVARFLRSCAGVGMTCPYSAGEIKHILAECVERGGVGELSYVDMMLTRGTNRGFIRGFVPDLRDTNVNFIAYAIPYVWIVPLDIQQQGIDIIVAKTRRIPDECVDARFKNFHWGDLVRAKIEAADAGAHNAVLCTPDGILAEGPGFNVFFIKDGALHTPARNMLEGITRQTVFDLAAEAGAPCHAGDYRPEDLHEADEVFICSTAGGIMPVIKVDDRVLSNGAPGPLSMKLHSLYWEKRAAGWLGTPVSRVLGHRAVA